MIDVTIDRHLYLGGSEIPTILNINPFKSRFDLLLEKAGFLENDFKGNEYTQYGNTLEPLIRDYINSVSESEFTENRVIKGDLRYHSDGVNKDTVLEIKTTSQIKADVNDYKVYLVQLLFGMILNKKENGLLAVYDRPKDFDETFDAERLCVYQIHKQNYKHLISEIEVAIEDFRKDLEKVKRNPFIEESDLQPTELIKVSNEVIRLEAELIGFKEKEAELKELKERLKSLMESHSVKKWTTPNGTHITLVAYGEDKEVETFDEKKFKEDNQEIYNNYLKTTKKKGRSGYVKITTPKN